MDNRGPGPARADDQGPGPWPLKRKDAPSGSEIPGPDVLPRPRRGRDPTRRSRAPRVVLGAVDAPDTEPRPRRPDARRPSLPAALPVPPHPRGSARTEGQKVGALGVPPPSASKEDRRVKFEGRVEVSTQVGK